MKRIIPLIAIILALSCTSRNQKASNANLYPVKYENELFSFSLPEGWKYDDSKWMGPDSMQYEVDFYNPDDGVVWFHFVKAYYPLNWEDINEAVEFAKSARTLSGDSVSLIQEYDNVTISSHPTKVLVYANYVDNDTIIQKQHVTYLKKSNILLYLNENFLYKDWDAAQEIGDELMKNVIIKTADDLHYRFRLIKNK